MLELMANDSTTSLSVTKGTVRWCPNNAFFQAFENKPKYANRVKQVGLGILLVRGNIQTYYTSSQSRSQNTGNSMDSYMAEMIRELEVENNHQQAHIEALTIQMATKESVYEACFRTFEALFFHGSSFSSVPEVAHPKGGNTKFGSPKKVVFVHTTIFRLDHFGDYT